MAKIDRYGGNLEAFASEAIGQERTVFGTETFDDSLTAQINALFRRGWGIVAPADAPKLQDFNALGYTTTQVLAYLHQMGIAEWNAAQEYYEGSVVTTLAGIYRLKSGGVGSSDPDTDGGVNWELIPTQAKVDAKADQATTYTETEVDGLLDAKANQATTYTKLETVAEFNQYGLGAGSFSGEPNIDLILTAGTYISVLSGHVNFPPGDNNRAIITIGGSSSDYIKQEIQQVRSPYRRFYRASPTAEIGAQAWIEIAQLSEVNNLLDDKAAISGQAFSGNISAPNLSGTNTGDGVLAIGVGQTWQIVSRASGVTYTNTTGKPITAVVNIRDSGNDNPVTAFVGATRVIYNHDLTGGAGSSLTFIIPAGSTYKSDYSPNPLESWVELR